MSVDVILATSGTLSLISLAVVLFNLLTAPRLKPTVSNTNSQPKISVLIPARNEEQNIGNLIDDLAHQTYNNIEILILNDESEDQTLPIIQQKQIQYQGVKNIILIEGQPLPPGWLGKNWACHQLSEAASGEYLIFVDADVRLHPQAIESSLGTLQKTKVDVLSCFPTQKMAALGEFLVVPLMNFFLLSFLPLWFVVGTRWNMFVAANGQFLLFRTEVYRRLGGHEASKGNVIEDMIIAKRAKKMGHRLITLIDEGCVSCRMYDGFRSAFHGFTKNFYAGFHFTAPLFLLVNGLYFLTFLLPIILVFFKMDLWVVVLFDGIIRLLISWQSHQNALINILLHPFQMLVMAAIAFQSFYRTKFNKLSWKGRRLSL